MTERKRILSGMRPTGRLHLGNLHGALDNWIELQTQYDCFFFVADWHALTTDYATPGDIQHNTWDMVLDWLASALTRNTDAFHPVGRQGTCRALSPPRDDHAAALAGTQSHL